jgi:hypothetical protein
MYESIEMPHSHPKPEFGIWCDNPIRVVMYCRGEKAE